MEPPINATNAPLAHAEAAKQSPTLGIGAALAVYFAIVLPYLNYFPIWDSLEYLEHYLFLPRLHLTLEDLLVTHNGHPAFGYFWPFWLGQWLFPERLLVVQILSLLLGSLAIISFGNIVALAFRGLANRWQIGLLTVAFAVQPVFVANAISMSPDYGVLAYFLATLWLLYARRLGWVALTGFLLIFCKETGIVFYTLTVALFLAGGLRSNRRYPGAVDQSEAGKHPASPRIFTFVARVKEPGESAAGGVAVRQRSELLLTWDYDLWPLVLPYAGYVLFGVFQNVNGYAVSPYAAQWLKDSNLSLYFPNPFADDFKMACLGPFILEFQWIFSAFILAGFLAGLFARRPTGTAGSGIRLWLQKFNLPFRACGLLLAGCLYVVSRTLPWTNQRYLLVLYPLILLCFLAAMVQLRFGPRLRASLLTGTILLLFACNFRTLDPLSRKIAGTINFGNHKLLSIGTIRPDIGALNRDCLVYNLEYTYISYLLDDALAEIKPTNQTNLDLQDQAWWVMTRLDPATYHRSELQTSPYITPIISSTDRVIDGSSRPEKMYYIALPYLHNLEALTKLELFYNVQDILVFGDHGYELKIYQMTRKPAAAATATPPGWPDRAQKSRGQAAIAGSNQTSLLARSH